MAARFPGANSIYQALAETPVNLNKAQGSCLWPWWQYISHWIPACHLLWAGVGSLTRVVQARVACPGQWGGHITHRHYCTIQGEHTMPDRSTGERTGTLQPMLSHLSTHTSQGLPEERTALCSPKQACCLGWIQWKVTPAFVLAEYISCQESKRYLGALWLHLLKLLAGYSLLRAKLFLQCPPSLGERANSASWWGCGHSTLQTMGLWPLLHSRWGCTIDPLRGSWLLSRTELGKAGQGQVHQIWHTKVNFVPL